MPNLKTLLLFLCCLVNLIASSQEALISLNWNENINLPAATLQNHPILRSQIAGRQVFTPSTIGIPKPLRDSLKKFDFEPKSFIEPSGYHSFIYDQSRLYLLQNVDSDIRIQDLRGSAMKWSISLVQGVNPGILDNVVLIGGARLPLGEENTFAFLFNTDEGLRVCFYSLSLSRWEKLERKPLELELLGNERVFSMGIHQLAIAQGNQLHIYHTITNKWIKAKLELPDNLEALQYWPRENGLWVLAKSQKDERLLIGGEWKENTVVSGISLGVIGIYLAFLVGLGIYFSSKQLSTDDFFKASGRIPWWAAGISIFGTQLSAITFMAVPAKTYATDWRLFTLSMTILLAAPFVIRLFLPFYRKTNITTAYEFLEHRFNLLTRILGACLFMLLQVGRLGIVLLLPSLALSIVSGISIQYCIVAMGVLSIIYTVLGGIEAVIWTDVLQVFVLMGGAALCLFLMLSGLDESLSGQWAELRQMEKLKIFDWVFDVKRPGFWVVLVGGLASNIIQYGTDQTVVQRYLTTSDENSAAKGIRLGAWMALPSTLLFFSIGTALFLFYGEQPEKLPLSMNSGDTIFPWFIVQELSPVWVGLLLAAVFAAAMSSLDSSMNSVATVVTHDFFKRFKPGQEERTYLNFARICTFLVGGLAIFIALAMASWGISSLWDQFNLIVGLFAGGLGGIFLLGILVKKANGNGALAGLLVSALVQYFLKSSDEIHLQLFAFTGMATSFIVGYLVSLIRK